MSDWTWDWDKKSITADILKKDAVITRWRRGWITLYHIQTKSQIEWHLYLPFGFNIGRTIDVKIS